MPAIFRPGCSTEQLANCEKKLGLSLPDDYREFLLSFDGQEDAYTLSFPPGQLVFLSIDEVVNLWSELSRYSDRAFFERVEDDERVRAVVYDYQRIPIAYNEIGGTGLFLDAIPGPRGTPMQLITNPNEAEFRVVAASLSDLLHCYLGLLESGQMRIETKPEQFGTGFWFTTAAGEPLDFESYSRVRVRPDRR
jgi:cell wall assembly regulator SMI1